MTSLQIVGFSGSGKTTLIVALLDLLRIRGLRAGAVKHHAGRLTGDSKDSARLHAGGAPTVLVSDDGILEMAEEPALEDALQRLPRDLDVILIEGWKRRAGPKIWMGPGCPEDLDGLLAVVGGRAPAGKMEIAGGRPEEVFRTVLVPLLEGTSPR